MATKILHSLLLIIFVFSLLFPSQSEATARRPASFVLPVRKDSASSLHVTTIRKRTPFQSLEFVVDLNHKFLWTDCETNYSSSTYRTPFCHSTYCATTGTHYCFKCNNAPARPGCHNNTCGVMVTNPIIHKTVLGELAQDVLSVHPAQGPNPGPFINIPQFLFACAPSRLLRELPKNAQGVVGLGHNPLSLPYQLASYFGIRPKFALCLTSSNNDYGVIFIGRGPYKLLPSVDVSSPLTFVPLTVSPKGEYYIPLTSIAIDNIPTPLNTSLTSAMISTTQPYTTLEHSIFMAVTDLYANQLHAPQIKPPVSPFGLCFNSSYIAWSRMGPSVPSIDLVFQNGNVTWSIIGANSMVQARPGVLCLGFVDGGLNPRARVIIGSTQLENNLLLFDVARSMFGFSSSLFLRHENCANFNFTTTP